VFEHILEDVLPWYDQFVFQNITVVCKMKADEWLQQVSDRAEGPIRGKDKNSGDHVLDILELNRTCDCSLSSVTKKGS
jgi:hypothetical protein